MATEMIGVGTRGSTKDCLNHFYRTIQTFTDETQARFAQDILRFLGVSGETAQGWADGKYFPKGLNLLRLQYYLRSSLGYVVTEVENLPTSVQELNGLIAKRVVDVKDAADKMNFPDTSEMFRVLLGKRVTQNKVKIIEEYLKNQALGDKIAESETHSHVSNQQLGEIIKTGVKDLLHPILADALKALYSIEKIILPEARALLEQSSDTERVLFREGLEKDFLFALSNKTHDLNDLLSALCSEKARASKFEKLKPENKK